MDTANQESTKLYSVSVASGGAEEPKNLNQDSGKSSPN